MIFIIIDVFVWWFQCGAHVYVCGDAKHMAHDVHRELVKVIEGKGQRSQAEAELYLQKMEQSQRYQKDIWVT